VQCHVDSGAVQAGGYITNRSYSYRAGGWTADPLDDIKEAFSFTAPASSHNLKDISTFINGKWGYTADSNPCVACHDPHAAQGDPLASPNSTKSSGTRGLLVSRPSQHASTPWNLWGDDMLDYTTNYQAPFRFGTTSAYEPDGSTTQDGSNLTDFNTFCSDCHNATNTIYSTNLGRNLRTIDWENEKHGKGNANTSLCGDNPYPSGGSGLGKVLSCLDCHEPHGSSNAFLIREEVNGVALGGTIGSFSTTNWHYLCDRCHQDDKEINASCQEDHYYISHHVNTGCNSDRPYNPSSCSTCHGGGGGGGGDCTSGRSKMICTDCHFHGSSVSGNPTF
jgi:predicted CXXCH cytochrome family protein